MHRARRTVEAGVRARDGRRQDDEREERRDARHAIVRERHREDTLVEPGLIPRQDGNQERNRDDVERDDAPRHVAHGDGDALLRLFALAGREADDLRALEVDEDDDHREDDGPVAVRREAAAAEQHGRAEVALVADDAEADEPRDDGEGHERDNFEQGEPELAFAELVDVEQVDGRHEESEQHGPPELADGRHEVRHDDAGGDHF